MGKTSEQKVEINEDVEREADYKYGLAKDIAAYFGEACNELVEYIIGLLQSHPEASVFFDDNDVR